MLLQVEMLARQVLQSPVEVEVGGRSVVNQDIDQRVEVREAGDRFLRLLEILGDYSGKGKVLVFVNSQEKCDQLFRDLLGVRFPSLCRAPDAELELDGGCHGDCSFWPVFIIKSTGSFGVFALFQIAVLRETACPARFGNRDQA